MRCLAGFKASGKPLCVYLPRGGAAKTFYVASIADRLFLGTEALAEPSGYAVTTPYPRRIARSRRYRPRGDCSRPLQDHGGTDGAGKHERKPNASRWARIWTQFTTTWCPLSPKVGASSRARFARSSTRGCSRLKKPNSVDCATRYCTRMRVATTLDPDRAEGAVLVELKSYIARRRIRFRPLLRKPTLAVLPLQGPIVEKSPVALLLRRRRADHRRALP